MTFEVEATEPVFGFYVGNVRLVNVHPETACRTEGHPCVIHSPSDHHMQGWRLLWRGDRGMFERTCEHGVGHPDPDDFGYHERNGRSHLGSHGCDGCCCPPETG